MTQHDTLWINGTLSIITEQGVSETLESGAIACKDGLISLISPMDKLEAVSYTHLTLPTLLLV